MTKDIKKTEIKPEILAMRDLIRKELTVSKKDGTIGKTDDIYEKTLPAGLTMEIANSLSDHNKLFVPAAVYAFGMCSFEALKAHKGIEGVSLDIEMAKNDKISLSSERKRVTHTVGESPKEIITHNAVSFSLELRAAKSGAQLKAVRSEVSRLAEELTMAALSK